jgi:hypothetical protein
MSCACQRCDSTSVDASDGMSRYCSASPVLRVATVLSKFSMSLMLPPSHRRVNLSSHRPLYVTAELAATAAAEGWPVCLYSLMATSSGSVNSSWKYLTHHNEFTSKRLLHDPSSFSPSEALVEVGAQLLLLHVLLVQLVYSAKIKTVNHKTCNNMNESANKKRRSHEQNAHRHRDSRR